MPDGENLVSTPTRGDSLRVVPVVNKQAETAQAARRHVREAEMRVVEQIEHMRQLGHRSEQGERLLLNFKDFLYLARRHLRDAEAAKQDP
jgi:hypothetical protein